ncbi:hypothetical protein [Sulfuricurvum sp.]|uniref:hypothetical protein n=1 Tax=Sulfuricurvum sp. TaxID=2025608 RepID=UPI002622B6A0|nr:hypothetical protein [Sulfuricurvum sp.]MDD4882997.1 hypothetical protein [Sulfuricurvum sp.]
MALYTPIYDSLYKYKSLDIYEEYISINGEDNFPIKDIKCEINGVVRGGKNPYQKGVVSGGWTSLVMYKGNEQIGEFFFEIATENDFYDLTVDRVKQLIEDIQNSVVINYDQRVQNDIQASKEDKKGETIVIVVMIFFTLIPFGAGFAIYFMTR